MPNKDGPIRDKERSIKYSYSVPAEEWATEMFLRDLEFGNPELLENEYYRSIRATMREKADPSERVPRIDLVRLLDESPISRGSDNGKDVTLHRQRASYMDLIAKDPGMMYDFSIYEETKAREEEERRIQREVEQERQREEEELARSVPEPPHEEPVKVDTQLPEPEKPPEPVQVEFLGALVPLETWYSMTEGVNKIRDILKEAIREKEWYETVPMTIKETNEFRMFDYLYTRRSVTDGEIEWASTLYSISLTRMSIFLEIHGSMMPSSKRIKKSVDRLINRKRMQVVNHDLRLVKEQEKQKKKIAKKVSWRLRNA
jgi:hypothetical protein